MNIALPPAVAASYFVHEMYHAQQEKTGKSGHAKTMEKSAFVKKMVTEEIVGTVKGYQAFMELEEKGQVPPDAARPPHYADFTSAYKAGRETAQKANPTAAGPELHEAGIKNAAAALRWWVGEGGLGPAKGITYAQSYGAEWEKAQRNP
jgi:hypothetical protein